MTSPVSDIDLLLLAADALEPGAAAALRARLGTDAALRQRFERLCRHQPGGAAVAADRWRIPPPGAALAPLLQRTAHLAAAAGNQVRVGDSFSLWFDTPADPSATGVVLLGRRDGDWRVVSPRLPHDTRSVADIARVEGPRCRVELIAHPPAGSQRWAVALHPLPLPEGRDDDPWAPLRAAVEAGSLAVGAVEIDVTDQGDG